MSHPLLTLPVLLVDCQTTGSTPEKGHLLEVGWLPFQADEASPPEAWEVCQSLVHLPEGAMIPSRVQWLTGIPEQCLDDAEMDGAVWRRLTAAAADVARLGGVQHCPTVVHFARFERPFLEALQQKCDPGALFPLELICTHEISRRLYPALPRRGIRALAGYLGYSLPSARRCDGHVRATGVIWRNLVQRLTQEQVATLVDLHRWLSERQIPCDVPRSYPLPRSQRRDVPDAPGVYRFLRSNGDLLYIGKARSLKTRLNSYFQARRRHSERSLEMLTQAARVEVTVTGSALEAALKESEAIKQCAPPYNVALTEGSRTLIFVARDFSRFAKVPDGTCRIGPVVSCDLIRLVRAIGLAWMQRVTGESAKGLDAEPIVAARLCPDEMVLGQGLQHFWVKHADLFNRLGPWRALMRVGRDSWQERMKTAEPDRHSQDTTDAESDPEAPRHAAFSEWTPEVVCRRIEGLMRHCAHQLRRARWFTLLTEAAIAWNKGAGDCNEKNALVIHRGRIDDYLQVGHMAIPLPPEHGRRWRDRLSHLDLQAYDRLRVLTTELRRLLAENRFVCVRLGPAVYLNSAQLSNLLKWI